MKYPKSHFDNSSDDGYSKMNPQDDHSNDTHTTFEKNWKDALFDSEVNPPDEIWIELENKLPVFEKSKSKNRSKVYIFIRFGAAMTLLLIITFIAGFYHGKMESNDFATPNIIDNHKTNTLALDGFNSSSFIVEESQKNETKFTNIDKIIFPNKPVLESIKNDQSNYSEHSLSVSNAQSDNFRIENNHQLYQDQLKGSANDPPVFAENERTAFLGINDENIKFETPTIEKSYTQCETNYTSLFRDLMFDKSRSTKDRINFTDGFSKNATKTSFENISLKNNLTDSFALDKQNPDTASNLIPNKIEPNLATNPASESLVFQKSVKNEQPLPNNFQAPTVKKSKWILATAFNTITLNDNIQYNQTVAQPNYTMEKRTSISGVSESRYMEDEAKVPVETQWTPLMSYSGSIEVGYRMNSHFNFQSGIQYSYQQTHRKGDFMLADSMGKLIMLPNNIPYDQTQSYELKNESFSVTQSLQYIGLPIKVVFKAGKKSTKFISSAGLLANFLIKSSNLSAESNKEGATLSPKQAKEPSMYSPMHLSTFLGTGIEWNFAQKYALQVEPNVRFSLTSLTKPEIAYSHPFSVGLSLTLLMNLQ